MHPSLKKLFKGHRDSLGETGQGLVDGDQEEAITTGSALENVWRKSRSHWFSASAVMLMCITESIQAKFPWFKRINNLMGKSPIVSKVAAANSFTEADTSILDRSVGDCLFIDM